MEEIFSLIWKARTAKRSKTSLFELQRKRLSEVITYARLHSPFYKDYYQSAPGIVTDVTALPVTDKRMLMARFDDWCTDRTVTLDRANEFAKNVKLIGEKFQGRYTLSTTSGTTGHQGVFHQP